MKLLADEGVDRATVVALREAGFDVFYIAEAQSGITDDQVLSLALESERLLITVDKDFGELVFRLKRASPGVLLLRLSTLTTEQRASHTLAVITAHGVGLPGNFTVIKPKVTRIRRPPGAGA